MADSSALDAMARTVVLFVLLSVPWWAGGALLGAASPRGKVGWPVRAALAVVGAVAILLLDALVWWLVVELGGAGRAVTSRWEYGTVAANVAAALAAVVLVVRRRRGRRGDAETVAPPAR